MALTEINAFTVSLLVILLALSAFFSSAEAAFLSAQRVRLHYLISTGSRPARMVEQLVEDKTLLLTSILIGNNTVNTAVAALVTVIVETRLNSEAAGVVVSTVMVTLLLLLFGEIAPKTIGVQQAERLALWYAYPLQLFIWLLLPITLPLSRVIPQRQARSDEAADAELRTMVATGKVTGSLDPAEAEMVEKILVFGDKMVRDIMIPRPEIVWVKEGTTLRQFLAQYVVTPFTRYPVYRDEVDNAVGVLSMKDVLRARAEGAVRDDTVVTTLAQPALFTPETKRVGPLFRQMRESGERVALVVDEFGIIAGMVTLQEFLEEIVGPMGDGDRDTVQEITEDMFQVDASLSIAEANEELDLDLPEGDYQTVAGFVLDRLGHIPQEGEQVHYNELDIVVDKMRGPRIERLVISRRD